MDQIKTTRDTAEEITDDLKHKMVQHAQLIGEFEKNNRCISRLVLVTPGKFLNTTYLCRNGFIVICIPQNPKFEDA